MPRDPWLERIREGGESIGRTGRLEPHAGLCHGQAPGRDHHAPGFVARWLLPAHHWDTGALFIRFGVFTALIDDVLSLLTGPECLAPDPAPGRKL